MGLNKLLYHISSALVVLLFSFAGLVKVVPGVSPQIHNDMRSKFSSYVGVPPINLLQLSPDAYLLIVGVTELVCVGLLLFGRSRMGVLATWVLLGVMGGALYTHYSVGDTLQDTAGAIAGLGFVLTRLYTMGALNQGVEIKIKL